MKKIKPIFLLVKEAWRIDQREMSWESEMVKAAALIAVGFVGIMAT